MDQSVSNVPELYESFRYLRGDYSPRCQIFGRPAPNYWPGRWHAVSIELNKGISDSNREKSIAVPSIRSLQNSLINGVLFSWIYLHHPHYTPQP
jgi:hypothetical protein